MTRDPRPLLQRANLTQEAAARLLGTQTRAVERWCCTEGSSAREMPETARRLLMVIADVPGVAAYLDGLAKG